MARTADGEKVKVGDFVEFKCDVEQYGKVIKIKGSTLVLSNPNGFSGHYIGGKTETEQEADRCWLCDSD